MYCREVKYRLNNSIELDFRLLEHARFCKKCRAEIQSANLIKSAWCSAKDESASKVPNFEVLKARVLANSAHDISKEMTLMAKIKNEIEKHPKFSLGAAAAVTLFIIILVVPITINKTVGYDVAFPNVQTAGLITQGQLKDLAEAFGYGNASIEVSRTNDGYNYAIGNLPDSRAAREMAYAFTELTGYDGEPVVRPKVMPVSGTIYAQAKEKIKIEIQTKDKSDEEIQEEISKKLSEMGYKPGAIRVKTNSDGKRTITLAMNDSTRLTFLDCDIRMDFNENGDIELGKVEDFKTAITIDTKGKSTDEIKKEVVEQLKAKGVKNPEVEVLQNEDGLIELKIKKDDNN